MAQPIDIDNPFYLLDKALEVFEQKDAKKGELRRAFTIGSLQEGLENKAVKISRELVEEIINKLK